MISIHRGDVKGRDCYLQLNVFFGYKISDLKP